MYEALERADGDVEKIDWPMFRKVLIDQAEQVCLDFWGLHQEQGTGAVFQTPP